MADISKIKLPSGNTYDIKDAVARAMIAGGITFIIAWDGASTPVVADIPAGVKVKYNNVEYTGTLSAETSAQAAEPHAQPGAFYLVKSSTTPSGETLDIYDEYVPIGVDGSKSWEKIGDTQINLSDVVTNVTLNKTQDTVLGTGTTFSGASSSVSFANHTTDNALGEATTFTTTVTPSTTYLGASVTDGDFVTSVSAETGKNLDTTTITGTDGTESVSVVSKSASKLVTTSVPNVTSAGSASTWTFSMGQGGTGNPDTETLVISGGNSVAPTLGTAITAATGAISADGTGSDTLSNLTISSKTVAKAAASATTVATGTTSVSGTGDAVVTGVSVGSTAKALTGVSLASNDSSATGRVQVATGISSASTSAGSNDPVAAITALGAATAAGQTVTASSTDQVNVATYDSLTLSVTKGTV